MAMINCSECSKEVSDKAAACPNCGAPITASKPSQTCIACGTENPAEAAVCQKCNRILAIKRDGATCPKCEIPYITTQKDAKFSLVFFISVPMFIIGLFVLLFNWMLALFIIAMAFIIDFAGRKKKTVLICPKCRYEPY